MFDTPNEKSKMVSKSNVFLKTALMSTYIDLTAACLYIRLIKLKILFIVGININN